MSDILNTAITKMSAGAAAKVPVQFTSYEIEALLEFVKGRETEVNTKVPVVIGMPGVFVSRDSVSVFLSYDRDHDVSMSMIAHQAKKLLMEIASGKVD